MTDANKLVAMLDVRIREFERKMERAQRTTQRRTRAITREFERTNQSASRMLSGIARTFAGGLAGVLGGFSAVALTRGIRSAVSELSNMGKAARDVGLDVEELQGLMRGFARASRISEGDASAAFERFNRRIGEAVNGAGPLNTTIERYGIRLRNANGEMRTQSDLLREFASRIRDAGTEQERAAIAQSAFGDVGRRMADAMAAGPEALDQMVRQAREAGDIIDRNLIHRAEILDDKFDALTRRVRTFFQTLAVGMLGGGAETPADTLVSIFGDLDRAKAVLGDGLFESLIAETGELEDAARAALAQIEQGVEAVSDRAAVMVNGLNASVISLRAMGEIDAARAMADAANEITALVDGVRAGEVTFADFEARLVAIVRQSNLVVRALRDVDRSEFGLLTSGLNRLIRDLSRVANQARDAANAIRAISDTSETPDTRFGPGNNEPLGAGNRVVPVVTEGAGTTRPRAAPPDFGPPVANQRGGGGGRSGGRPDVSEYEREIAAIRERTAALEAEAAVLATATASGREYGEAARYAAEYVRLMTAAQRDGMTITPQVAAEIEALADAYARTAENADRAAEAMRNAQDDAKAGANAMADLFGSMLQGSDAARQALARLLVQIAQVQMQKAMMGMASGGGGFFKFIGSLLAAPAAPLPPAAPAAHDAPAAPGAVQKMGARNLDALHRSVQGYARGGFVGAGMAPLATGAGGSGRIEVSARVHVDDDGKLRAVIEEVSGDVAGQRIRRATPEIMAQSAALVREQAQEFPLP